VAIAKLSAKLNSGVELCRFAVIRAAVALNNSSRNLASFAQFLRIDACENNPELDF
jgi:pantothenate synthetase